MPGYMTNDSLTFFAYANKLDSIVLYHPPLMAWIFSIGRLFSPDQSAILLMQVFLYLGSVLFLLSSTIRSKKFIAACLLIVAIFPSLFPISGVLWKSVWMTSFLFYAVGGFIRYYKGNSIPYLFFAILCSLFAMLTRFDAVVPVAIILFLPLIKWLNPKVSNLKLRPALQAGALIAVSSVIVLLIMIVNYSVVNRINTSLTVGSLYPMHVPLYQDILAINIQSKKIYLPDYIKSDNPGITVENLEKAYSQNTCNGFLRVMGKKIDNPPYILRRPANVIEYNQFVNTWLEAVKENPSLYLKSRLTLLKNLWGCNNKVYYPFAVGVSKNKMGLSADMTTVKELAENYSRFFAVKVKIFHRAYIYVILGLFFTVLIFFRMKLINGVGYAVVPFAGVMHFVALSFITCAGDFRFAFFLVASVLVGGLMLLGRRIDVIPEESDLITESDYNG